jgi:hypothetical protein
MTVSAHNGRHVYRGATKIAHAHVRTVYPQRKPLGWLECSADEFFRLLALHEAGRINLLTMPELSADNTSEVDPDEPEQMQPQPEAETARVGDTHLGRILRCLGRNALTHKQIAESAGLTRRQVKSSMSANRVLFVVVPDGRKWDKLWRVK